MNDELFRPIIASAWLTLLPLMFYHRLKSRTSERLNRREEGTFILATLRPIGLSTLFATAFYLIDPQSMAWASVATPDAVRWLGVAMLAGGGALIIWTVRTLGPNLTDTVVTRREHTLVTAGPYRYVRHPFYDSIAFLTAGTGLASANGFLLGGGALLVALLVIRTRREEDRLLARFGDAYARYMRQTGRFLPSLGRRPAAAR